MTSAATAATTAVTTVTSDRHALERQLLDWLDERGRTLEVRTATGPWQVLVAEVMSQQTQIDRIGRPWRAFVERWPEPAALAQADTGELLRAWAGLGYNRRPLALREAARVLVRDHGGQVPDDLTMLERLPGIGPYTARAVLAASFGRPVAPLDVNVTRVVRRLLPASVDRRDIQTEADLLVSRRDPRRWVWAVMDLAATVCLRRTPRCDACPVAASCRSRGTGGEPGVASKAARRPSIPFTSTDRWLRGAIVARLRDRPKGRWTRFDGPIGERSREDVARVLGDLAADGFLQRRGDRARLV